MVLSVDDRGDHFETRHRRKDGSLCDVEISTNGAVYRGQKLAFCVCRDISARVAERKQIEADLRLTRFLSTKRPSGSFRPVRMPGFWTPTPCLPTARLSSAGAAPDVSAQSKRASGMGCRNRLP